VERCTSGRASLHGTMTQHSGRYGCSWRDTLANLRGAGARLDFGLLSVCPSGPGQDTPPSLDHVAALKLRFSHDQHRWLLLDSLHPDRFWGLDDDHVAHSFNATLHYFCAPGSSSALPRAAVRAMLSARIACSLIPMGACIAVRLSAFSLPGWTATDGTGLRRVASPAPRFSLSPFLSHPPVGVVPLFYDSPSQPQASFSASRDAYLGAPDPDPAWLPAPMSLIVFVPPDHIVRPAMLARARRHGLFFIMRARYRKLAKHWTKGLNCSRHKQILG
jgi:hypothetical protein